MIICISSLDAHIVLCTFQKHDVFILDQHCTPTLRHYIMFAGRRVSCRHYICLYSLMCEEQRALIIRYRWSTKYNFKSLTPKQYQNKSLPGPPGQTPLIFWF